MAADARNVEKIINPPEALQRIIQHTLPLLLRADIQRMQAQGRAFGKRSAQSLLIHIRQHKLVAALFQQDVCPMFADAACGAGDDRSFRGHLF